MPRNRGPSIQQLLDAEPARTAFEFRREDRVKLADGAPRWLRRTTLGDNFGFVTHVSSSGVSLLVGGDPFLIDPQYLQLVERAVLPSQVSQPPAQPQLLQHTPQPGAAAPAPVAVPDDAIEYAQGDPDDAGTDVAALAPRRVRKRKSAADAESKFEKKAHARAEPRVIGRPRNITARDVAGQHRILDELDEIARPDLASKFPHLDPITALGVGEEVMLQIYQLAKNDLELQKSLVTVRTQQRAAGLHNGGGNAWVNVLSSAKSAWGTVQREGEEGQTPHTLAMSKLHAILLEVGMYTTGIPGGAAPRLLAANWGTWCKEATRYLILHAIHHYMIHVRAEPLPSPPPRPSSAL